jgi:hypothetical protein
MIDDLSAINPELTPQHLLRRMRQRPPARSRRPLKSAQNSRLVRTPSRLARRDVGPVAKAAVLVSMIAAAGALVLLFAQGSAQIAACGALVALGVVFIIFAPSTAALLMLGFLALQGDFRRILISISSLQNNDPVLLVGPALAFSLVVAAHYRGGLSFSTMTSKLVLFLMIVMGFQIFNPEQGGIVIGLSGGLFYLVPLLWFWVGQQWGSPDTVTTLCKNIALPLGGLAILLGFYQIVFGLLPYQQAWVDAVGYASLHVGDRIRPLGFFTSSAEYISFVAICTTILIAMILHRWQPVLLIGIGIAAAALFLASSRSAVVMLAVATTVLWAIQGSSITTVVPRLLISLAGITALGYVGLSHLASADVSDDVAPLIQHQTQGLLNPADDSKSTAGLHASMVLDGILDGITNPLGRGLGSTAKGAAKYGGSTGSTELDISNAFSSLGLLGGTLYLTLVVRVFYTACGNWFLNRDLKSLVLLGIVVVGFGQWLIGGQYSTAALFWFCIGAIDREERGRRPHFSNALVARRLTMAARGAVA